MLAEQEKRVTLSDIFPASGAQQAIEFIETNDGFAAVDRHMVPDSSSVLLISFCGLTFYARLCGEAVITEDGDAIEGDALDYVQFIGVVTHKISRTDNGAGVF